MHIRNLAVLAYARGFTHWLYRQEVGTLAAVEAPGFFSDVAGMLTSGDLITVTASDGTGIRAITVTHGTVTLQGLI